MTSMPASCRARAMILAPRSWPSRPGFATTTRIFLLAMRARKLPADTTRGLRVVRPDAPVHGDAEQEHQRAEQEQGAAVRAGVRQRGPTVRLGGLGPGARRAAGGATR